MNVATPRRTGVGVRTVSVRAVVQTLVGLAGFFGIWELASRTDLVPSYYVPPPSVVLPTIGVLLVDPEFLRSVVATVLATAIALLVAIAIAVPAGLVLGSVPSVRKATMVVIEFVRPIPAVALIPLALLVAGTGPDTKIGLAVFASLWPILFNTMYALDEIDPLQVDTARAFGLGRPRILVRVALPNAAPFVLTGVRLSAAIALAVVVSVELYAAGNRGIGQFIVVAASGGTHMNEVLGATVLAGVIGLLINAGLERLHRSLFGWSIPHEVKR